jgi:hypothetical protein
MRQEVTRVHRWATDLDQLRNHLDAFFASFATGSSKLLQYVVSDSGLFIQRP